MNCRNIPFLVAAALVFFSLAQPTNAFFNNFVSVDEYNVYVDGEEDYFGAGGFIRGEGSVIAKPGYTIESISISGVPGGAFIANMSPPVLLGGGQRYYNVSFIVPVPSGTYNLSATVSYKEISTGIPGTEIVRVDTVTVP